MPVEKFGHPPPVVQSMILADAIHRDPTTKKYFILGTFNRVGSEKFPTSPTPLHLYMAITETRGLTVLRIRIVDVDELYGPIHESAHTVDLPDPTRNWEMTFSVAVIFPAPGDYRVQLLAGNELLRELRLPVVQAPPRVRPPDEP
ncbi:MAG TPA: hypothetical protein VH682_16955 [Gemmataceae bacterium]|jgi:hypothetical protein